MVARVLDGKAEAKSIRRNVSNRVASLADAHGIRPGLTVLLVGNDPASALYVRLKKRDCDETGIVCNVIRLTESVGQQDLVERIEDLNEDRTVHGILLQLPLPPHIDAPQVIENIDPKKDVDGITPFNLGMLALREPAHRCCTSKGVMTLLKRTGMNLLGLDAVVIGASNHVGRPMCLELLMADCTVTVLHEYSKDVRSHAQQADILISATGTGRLVKGDWVKPGAVVVDVGITTQPDGSLVGDVDFDAASQVASWITPVPGGVGPMTRVSILQNLLNAYDAQI